MGRAAARQRNSRQCDNYRKDQGGEVAAAGIERWRKRCGQRRVDYALRVHRQRMGNGAARVDHRRHAGVGRADHWQALLCRAQAR